MASEFPQPNWDGIVAPIIEVKLGEARVTQAKADERANLQKEQRDQELLRTQQYQASLAEAVAKRWELLESLHARELLESLNTSQNVWRGLGAIRRYHYPHDSITADSSVEFSLEAEYVTWGWKTQSVWTSEGWGEEKVPSPTGSRTSTQIGITPAGITYRSELKTAPGVIYPLEPHNTQSINLQGLNNYFKGPEFFEGNVLYVVDSIVSLDPIEGADTYNEGDTSLSRYLGKNHDDPFNFSYGPCGVFLLEAEHPQATEILTEVLKRSCIYRAKGNLLPFQLKERGELILREAGVKPVQKPNGFWGRLFG